MKKPLISFEEYEFFLNSGRPYWGYFWTKEGKIYEVEENLVTVVSSKPAWPLKSYGDSHRTVFFDTVKHPQISMMELGSNDVLYNESGEFVSVIEAKDQVKGEIKILKSQINYNLSFSLPEEQRKDYEIVDLKDVTLSAEAYSKIFTHILSFMKDVDLKKIPNEKISIQLHKIGVDSNRPDLYNLNLDDVEYNAHAFHSPTSHAVTAVIDEYSGDNAKLYSTFWNVQNMLGAHEFIGHRVKGWNDRAYYTHHLVYLFQMNHGTWENTTDFFKDYQKDRLNKDYIRENRNKELNAKYRLDYPGDATSEEIEKAKEDIRKMKFLRQTGLFEKERLHGQDSIRFYENLTRRISNPMYRNPFDEK